MIFYTSGTTGRPKGALLTHLNLVMNSTVNAFDANPIRRDDVVMGCLPLFHTFGQTVSMNSTFRVGATLLLQPRFDADAAIDADAPRARDAVLRRPDDVRPAARRRPPGRGAAASCATASRAARRCRWWCSSASRRPSPPRSTRATASRRPRRPRRSTSPGSAPGPAPSATRSGASRWRSPTRPSTTGSSCCRAGSLGEIVIRGHNVFAGYLDDPEATAEAIVDGWFRTGDIGTVDEDGFISIVDRKKDLIIRGGFNVYPREVEEVLARHPGGRPGRGDRGARRREGRGDLRRRGRPPPGRPSDADELIAWSREQLGRHKYPRRVEVLDALPMGPAHKVLKRELRTQYSTARRPHETHDATQIRLARRPEGEPGDDTSRFTHDEVPDARRRPAAAARRLPVAGPLHARPDERREVLRRPGRGRRRDGRRHGRAWSRSRAHPDVRRRATSCCPTPAGRPTRSATAPALRKLDPSVAPLSTALGVLGMPGFTAYAGLLEIGKPQPGETVVVAAATGPVGSAVGQIAKVKGARAVGIAGGPEKCRALLDEFGFDVAVDHRSPTFAEDLAAAVPDGIDVYFENVGGPVATRGAAAREPLRPDAGVRPGRRLQRDVARPRAATGCPAFMRLVLHQEPDRARLHPGRVHRGRTAATSCATCPAGSPTGRCATARTSSRAWRTRPRRSAACSPAQLRQAAGPGLSPTRTTGPALASGPPGPARRVTCPKMRKS